MSVEGNKTSYFDSSARFICRYPKIILGIIFLFTVALLSQTPNLKMQTATEALFYEDDPVLLKYREFQEQFGRDDLIVIAINPPEVFDLKFLNRLRDFHKELEKEVPHVKEVTSLINARSTEGKEDELVVEDLMEDWPEDANALADLKRRALANPLYENSLLSKDARFTTVVIEPLNFSSPVGVSQSLTSEEEVDLLSGFDEGDDFSESELEEKSEPPVERHQLSEAEINEIVETVEKVIKDYQGPEFPLYMGGTPIIDYVVKANMQKDMGLFMNLSLVIIGVFLFILFRRWSGVILPLLVVICSLVCTFGLMAIAGVPVKVPTQILPSFLLAVGVGDSVHVLTIFYRHFRLGYSKNDSILYAMSHSGGAIVMTSVTTAGGLASFISSDIAPIADLGIFAPIGVMLAMLFSVVMLPALLTVLPLRQEKSTKESDEEINKKKGEKLDKIITRIADFSISNPKGIMVACFILFIFSIAGAFKLGFSYAPLTWFPDEQKVRGDTKVIDENLRGSNSLEVLVDTEKENGWYEPELLTKLDELAQYMENYQSGKVFVGHASSVSDQLKEIHQALNENRIEFRVITDNKNLVAQEFLMFENSGTDDLEDVVDKQFSLARFTMKLPVLDAVEYTELIEHVEEKFNETFGSAAKITVTGIVAILMRTITAMSSSMVKSYLIAFVVIAVLMIFVMKNVRLGIFSMIPNLLPIIITLGMMGWCGLSLDAFTLLIGSIAIGLVVDDTIHFMHNFTKYYERSGDPREAVHQTLQTTGRAVLFTSLILSSGFFIFMFASMSNLFNFGFLTGFTILTALLAEFTLTPALMVLIVKKERPQSIEEK